MDNAQFTLAALAFIAFAIPIVGSLWKLFGIREQLQVSILDNRHRLELLEQKAEHLVDQQTAFLHGIQERLQHVRDRSLHTEAALDFRLSDLEQFIEKSTSFERRKKG